MGDGVRCRNELESECSAPLHCGVKKGFSDRSFFDTVSAEGLVEGVKSINT